MKKNILWPFLIFAIFVANPKILFAEKLTDCNNRFVTLVNPVRGRDLWFDKTLKPLKDQYEAVAKISAPVTWLLQYDTLLDKDLLGEIKSFNSNQELGVFLEVSPAFAKQARVIYPNDTPWFSPKAVFLSGYSQSDRRKLVDRLFEDFKSKFGYYPRSVGSWWIDSYSLNYMKEKYNIKAALIVADQKTTDNYGVWGQWWGVPYYPSKANILTPASSLENKQDVVVLQWAQRDPVLAIGDGPKFSNYSLQANDYVRQGKRTDYFKSLVNVYLDCKNPVGQITVGLETGIESVGYIGEYKNQLEILKNISNLQFVTMSQFAEKFAKIYPTFPLNEGIGYEDSFWNLTVSGRTNETLKEKIKYNPEISFRDYFVADGSDFLNRELPVKNDQNSTASSKSFFWIIIGLGIVSTIKKWFKIWIFSTLFAFSAFGLIFRSYHEYGWKVYLGPVLPEIELVQIGLVIICFLLFLSVNRKIKYLYLLPLSFCLDPLIQSIRFSFISNEYYFGVIVDTFRFIGLKVSNLGIFLVNSDLLPYQAAAFLKFDYAKIYSSIGASLIIYPFIHIIFGFALIYILSKFSFKIRFFVVAIMTGLLMWHLYNIFNTDPRLVMPNLLK